MEENLENRSFDDELAEYEEQPIEQEEEVTLTDQS